MQIILQFLDQMIKPIQV